VREVMLPANEEYRS